MINTLDKSYKISFAYIFVLFFSLSTSAQCLLTETVQYNAENKITVHQINTFDKKGNVLSKIQKVNGPYQSNAKYEYNNQNKLIKTTVLQGENVLRKDSSSFESNSNKEYKTNALGEKNTEESTFANNTSVKIKKDNQGKTTETETKKFENDKMVFREIKNDKNQIVSRETFLYNSNENLIKSETFDGISDQSLTILNTYNINNQIIKSEKLINNTVVNYTLYTYQKNKIERKENYSNDSKPDFYQIYTYTKNTSMESIFHRDILHSKIITTFDKQNNPVEILNYNDKEKLTSKTINTFDCTNKL
jgi:hypothetical protein